MLVEAVPQAVSPTFATRSERVAAALADRPAGHSLPRPFYTDQEFYEVDIEQIWSKEWVFAGHSCEIPAPGDYFTMQVGPFGLIVVRGTDGVVRALHNVCRHRGFQVCSEPSGSKRRRFVCPYHQWSYDLDGTLAVARSMEPDFERSGYGLASAWCEDIGGMIFVCVADTAPDVAPMRAMIEPYLAPFDLRSAKVAFESTVVEAGNWKLVMENNRECFHCRTAHPELCASFPESPLHSGGGSDAELAEQQALVERCEALGLPSRYRSAVDFQYRVMRTSLLAPAVSMTPDGKRAVSHNLGALPDGNLGDVLCYHYPSLWSHFTADHAITFRMTPISVTETELRTCWLVPGDAVEGIDYDLANLTSVWLATNDQDRRLVEQTQRGVNSPAFRPGPYSATEEEGVIQFIDWYTKTIGERLAAADRLASDTDG